MIVLVNVLQRVSFMSIEICQRSNSIVISEHFLRSFEEEQYRQYERRLWKYMNDDY